MLLRLIAAKWLTEENPDARRVMEGEFTEAQWKKHNADGYNTYFLPNHPSEYIKGRTVDGSQIDVFNYIYIDFDLKLGVYASKEAFLETLSSLPLLPTRIVDSGGGIHAYWRVSDLDAKSYLRLSRRLMRLLNTDEAVGQLYQLMRLPGSVNVKKKDDFRLCEELMAVEGSYTCEEMDAALPPITQADEDYCTQHYDKTYKVKGEVQVDDKIPVKFTKLLRDNSEVKDIWSGNVDDRSKADYRLGHLMFAAGLSKAEAMSVLVNSDKAKGRAPVHRVGYAENIVGKIWTDGPPEMAPEPLSESVEDILASSDDEALAGTRFACHTVIDNTEAGFRLGQVIGLVGGSGAGKTTMAINMFRWFVERNPEYDHMFVSLEQPTREIARRWKTLCGDNKQLHSKVHIIGNYNKDDTFRNLSLSEIKDYVLEFKSKTGRKIGTVVIDHIGVLKMKNKDGKNQGIIDVCHEMKPFALQTGTMVIMQSQAPREKAGDGDLELNKDAAYGTVFFESYVDALLTIWQPVKKQYANGAPTVMAYKFCKIRHKKQGFDKIQEDVRYCLFLDPQSEQLRELNELEQKRLAWFNLKEISRRKEDKKLQLIEYVSLKTKDGDVKHSDNQDPQGTGSTSGLH